MVSSPARTRGPLPLPASVPVHPGLRPAGTGSHSRLGHEATRSTRRLSFTSTPVCEVRELAPTETILSLTAEELTALVQRH